MKYSIFRPYENNILSIIMKIAKIGKLVNCLLKTAEQGNLINKNDPIISKR